MLSNECLRPLNFDTTHTVSLDLAPVSAGVEPQRSLDVGCERFGLQQLHTRLPPRANVSCTLGHWPAQAQRGSSTTACQLVSLGSPPWYVGLEGTVHFDTPPLVKGHTHLLQPKVLCVWPATNTDQQHITGHLRGRGWEGRGVGEGREEGRRGKGCAECYVSLAHHNASNRTASA